MAAITNQNGRTGAEGVDAPRPPSRVAEIASRGDAPSPEGIGSLAYAGALDCVTGALTPREIGGMCRGLQTFISVAKNVIPVQDLCDRIVMAEKEAKAEKIAALEAELAALKT